MMIRHKRGRSRFNTDSVNKETFVDLTGISDHLVYNKSKPASFSP